MKYLCEACERLVEPRAFRIESEVLVVACPQCGSESRARAAAGSAPPARAVAMPSVPRPAPVISIAPPPRRITDPEQEVVRIVPAAERCPKCAATKRPGAESCAKCGLVFERYRPEEDVIPDVIRREFAQILEGWGTPEIQPLLGDLSPLKLRFFGRLARHHLADFPGDARAQGLLEHLMNKSLALASAAATVTAQGEAQSGSASRNRLLLAGMAAVLLVLLLTLVLWHPGR